ncbi:MAG: cardiolipin synthase [Ruminococcaceae bacterium]|nr:cardiolipin synthase [Oscillospiraceae bacterium]
MPKETENKKYFRISATYIRSSILALLFLLQIAVFILLIDYGAKYFWLYTALEMLSAVVTVALIARNDNPAYKVAWIVVIMALPIFGICIYIVFGANSLKKADMMRLSRIERKYVDAVKKNMPDTSEIIFDSGNALSQAKYLQNTISAITFGKTETKYYPLGDDAFPAMLDALRSAEKFIFLEYFIIERGIMWNSILEILTQKAKEGVDVRVIYDDVGSMLTLPHSYPSKLRALGIKCIAFRRFVPILSSSFNNRDHRKICIVDGKIAFTGGINLADEYINVRERFGHWLDCAVSVRGDAVASFTAMFLSMWEYRTWKESNILDFLPQKDALCETEDDGYLIPYYDSPCDENQTGEDVYLNMISHAQNYVYICTPYLAVGYQMISALTRAAKSGVDVRIMMPGIPDKPLVHSLSRSYYETLIKAGVKIYEYTPGFVHAKTFVCDDSLAVCGTINLDFRSLCLHHECALWMYKSSAVYEIRDAFLANIGKCKEIDREWCKKTSPLTRIARVVLRLFSPLI